MIACYKGNVKCGTNHYNNSNELFGCLYSGSMADAVYCVGAPDTISYGGNLPSTYLCY